MREQYLYWHILHRKRRKQIRCAGMDSSQLIGFSCTLCLIPNSSSIVTPSVSAIIGRSIISGIVALFSHFEIACDDTPIIPARFSCVRPLSLRSSAIFSPNVFIFYRFPSLLLLFSVNRDPYYISCFKKCTDIIGRVIPTVLIENQPKKAESGYGFDPPNSLPKGWLTVRSILSLLYCPRAYLPPVLHSFFRLVTDCKSTLSQAFRFCFFIFPPRRRQSAKEQVSSIYHQRSKTVYRMQ